MVLRERRRRRTINEWEEEEAARQFMAGYYSKPVKQVDPGGGAEQLWDFDVILEDGHIAVEVTSQNSKMVRMFNDAVASIDWSSIGLHGAWYVVAHPFTRVKWLATMLPSLTAAMTAASISAVHLTPDLVADHDLVYGPILAERGRLAAAGLIDSVRHAYQRGLVRVALLQDGPGMAYINRPAIGGAMNPDAIAEVVELHSTGRPDNLAKLAAATDHVERHLFIWVDGSDPNDAFTPLTWPEHSDLTSARTPALPAGVDVAWLASATVNGHVIRYDRENGWASAGRQ